MKEGGSWGFSIIGGTDHPCIPFGQQQHGIFISHVNIHSSRAEWLRIYIIYNVQICFIVLTFDDVRGIRLHSC